ncbi:MAG: hypothetical protein JWM44_224 [Bacilli bacterium]|nr:hypothetical protein [Bacilli bacterium]
MKRLLPTLILVLVCIGGFWYASSHSFFKEKAVEPQKLTTVQSADINAVQLQTVDAASGTASLIELTKSGTDWQMAKPATYTVNHLSVEGWNDAFSALTYDSKVGDNPTNLADFGLADPKQFFKVTLKDGTVKNLLVGNPLPVAGHVYAKLADAPAVYELSDQALQSITKQPLDFIETNAVQLKYDNVKSIQVEWKGAKWLLDKAQADKTVLESTWKLDGKDLKANEGTAILDKVVALATAQLPKAASDIKMDAPELRITVTESAAGKEAATTYIGKVDQENVWIVKQGDAWAYSVPTANVQAVYDASKPPEPSASPK